MMKGKSNSFKALAGFAGVGIYATTVYVSYHIYKLSNLPSPIPNCHLPENQSISEKIYTDLANTYDDSVTWDERLMLLKSKRKQLTNLAKGHVLETSAGTGRNLDFFKPEIIASLTISDSSQQMLQNALIKFRPLREAFDKLDISVDFKLMDSENLLYKDSTFDTVLDTFGLCSHQDPVKALTEMKRTCKENGKILLLEHGRSSYSWLNNALDKTALSHALKWGCWWNRDIEDLIRQAGLTVERIDRYHFGTTYMIVASPNKTTKAA